MAKTLISTQAAACEALLQRQHPIGIWQQSSNDNRLIPYFNHFGANALVVSAGQLTDRAAQSVLLTAVDKWLFWYLSHMQGDGTVHDYQVTDGVPEDTGNCDSTDSYAALFLMVLWNRLYVGGVPEKVSSWLPAINAAVRAMKLTEDPADGLTYAKPGWPKKYLMDNAEVMLGYRAAAKLYAWAGNGEKAAAALQKAVQINHTLETQFWLPQVQYYAWAKDKTGAMDAGMSKWYPDALANILYLAIGGDAANQRHQELMDRLAAMFMSDNQDAELTWHIRTEHFLWWMQAAAKLGRAEFALALWERVDLPDPAGLPMSVLGHVGRTAAVLQEPERCDWLLGGEEKTTGR